MNPAYDIQLTVQDLTLSRGNQTLIENLSFKVSPGQALWLTGPNGIGKTSLLLACSGLLAPDTGNVHWTQSGSDIPSREALAYAAHQGPERNGLTLGEDLAFWQTLSGDKLSLEERLASVGLGERALTPVVGLSAGQRRRLSLARLMASNRAAWLMDEPLSGLDNEGRSLVTNLLEAHLSSGGLAIIASHQPVPIGTDTAQKLVLEPGA